MEGTAKKPWWTTPSLVALALLALYPAGTLVAGFLHSRAVPVLEGSGHVALDDASTVRRYSDAGFLLKVAELIEPRNAVHRTAEGDVLLRLGKWTQAMEAMNAPLPAGAPRSAESFREAEAAFLKAIDRDPANADIHFSLAVLYDAADPLSGKAEKELDRAVRARPMNASMRYAAALEHLMNGRQGQALEEARELARLAGGDDPASLFYAFEIAWRATGDMEVVQGLCPDDRKALKTLDEYVKWKGKKAAEG